MFLQASVILSTVGGGYLPQCMLGYPPTPPPPGSRRQHTVNERPVRMLLECILFDSASALSSRFYHCKVWIIKQIRNQKELLVRMQEDAYCPIFTIWRGPCPRGHCPGGLCQRDPFWKEHGTRDRDAPEGTWDQTARQEVTSYRDPLPLVDRLTDTRLALNFVCGP